MNIRIANIYYTRRMIKLTKCFCIIILLDLSWSNATTFTKVTKSHLPLQIIVVCITRREKSPFYLVKQSDIGKRELAKLVSVSFIVADKDPPTPIPTPDITFSSPSPCAFHPPHPPALHIVVACVVARQALVLVRGDLFGQKIFPTFSC